MRVQRRNPTAWSAVLLNLYAFGTGGQILSALFGPFGAWTRFGTTECPFNPNGEFATAGA